MARASAKRGRRPRANARAEQPVAAPEAAQAEAAPPEPKPQPRRTETEQASEEPRPERQRKQKPPPRPEDTMFFTRLRTHAKWVFVLLAAAFAIGFVAFGVGAGGTGFGDAISDFFGGGSDLPSIEEAQQAVNETPNDPAAVLDLANAYQADRQYQKAAETLERYNELAPEDVDGLRQLANVYAQRATALNQQAGALQASSQSGTFSQTAFSLPGTSGFLGALGDNPVDQALSGDTSARVEQLADQVSETYGQQAAVYERISELTPDDPQIFLQVGQAATQADQTERAVAAFERFLELAPDDPSAGAVKEQLEFLRSDVETRTG
jgi:regulator of sirC expression with transglutaminase-like and TPR domain